MKNFLAKDNRQAIALWLLLVICLAVLALLLWEIIDESVLGAYVLGMRHSHRLLPRLERQSMRVDQVQGWMTFEYLNSIFKLPPLVLQTNLAITDKHYPKLSVEAWAGQQGITSQQAVVRVQTVITNFLNRPPLNNNK